jgi:hypothetical protein
MRTAFCVDDQWYEFHYTLSVPIRHLKPTNAEIVDWFKEQGFKFDRRVGDIILVDDPARPELNLSDDPFEGL